MWFATISHKSLWNALEQVGIEPQYTSLLKRLYPEQKATVPTDKQSDAFERKRGTKYDEPLSSLLFNTALQAALRDGLTRRQEKGMGIRLGDSKTDCVTPEICRRRASVINIAGAAAEA